jgi:hypothetical protein
MVAPKRFTVSIDPEMHKAMRLTLMTEGRYFSDWLRDEVTAYLAKHGVTVTAPQKSKKVRRRKTNGARQEI